MVIEFPCRCGHVFKLDHDQAGLDIQCPSCGLLNAVPTHADLHAIAEDGTYKVESGPEVPNPDLAAELAYIYHRYPTDTAGNEKNLKLTTADIHAIDGGTIPLAPSPTLEQAPRYDPETGELITPIEVKPDEKERVDPSSIPMAKAAIEYATSHTARRNSFVAAFVHLFTPGNLAVMLAVMGMHILLFPVIFVTLMGIFLISFFLVAFVAGLFAHYGNVIEDIGPFEKDELPRPFRDLEWYDDLWRPFCNIMASLVICYLPGIIFGVVAVENGHEHLAAMVNLIWQSVGTFIFPAVLLSLHCSGSILNLRPDRVLAVIGECGAGYFVTVVAWVAAAFMYQWGILGTSIAMVSMMGSVSLPKWLISWPVVMAALSVGIFLMHYFSVCVGLLYRAHHGAFPWVLQKHIPTKKFANDGPPVRPVPAPNEPRRVRPVIELNDPTVSGATDPTEKLLGRWVLLKPHANGNSAQATEFVLKPNGRLDYVSAAAGQTRIMHLVYRVEGSFIVSMQLPQSKEVRTRYSFDVAGNLVLQLNGQKAIFRKVEEDSYSVA